MFKHKKKLFKPFTFLLAPLCVTSILIGSMAPFLMTGGWPGNWSWNTGDILFITLATQHNAQSNIIS